MCAHPQHADVSMHSSLFAAIQPLDRRMILHLVPHMLAVCDGRRRLQVTSLLCVVCSWLAYWAPQLTTSSITRCLACSSSSLSWPPCWHTLAATEAPGKERMRYTSQMFFLNNRETVDGRVASDKMCVRVNIFQTL